MGIKNSSPVSVLKQPETQIVSRSSPHGKNWKIVLVFLLVFLGTIFSLYSQAQVTVQSITGPTVNENGEFTLSFPAWSTNLVFRDIRVNSAKIIGTDEYSGQTLTFYLTREQTQQFVTLPAAGYWKFTHYENRHRCLQGTANRCAEPDDYDVIRGNHNVVVIATPISIPGAFSVPETNATGSYSLSWGASSGPVKNYELQEQVNGGGWVTVQKSSARSFSTSGKPNGVYQYRVNASNIIQSSGWSETRTVQVVYTPPVPSSINVVPGLGTDVGISSNGAFSVSWSDVGASASFYQLFRQQNGGGWGNPVLEGQNVSFSDVNLEDGSYHYQVRACSRVGSFTSCSGFRTSTEMTVLRAPGVPGRVWSSTYFSTDGVYSINWGPASGTVHRYELEEQVNGGAWSRITLGGNMNLSRTFTGTEARGNGSYGYRVRACNVNCSSWSTLLSDGSGGTAPVVTTVEVGLAPGVPGGLLVPASDNDGIFSVTWNAVSGTVDEYRFQGGNNEGNWSWGAAPYLSTTKTRVDIDYPHSVTALFRVQACYRGVCSAWSPAMSIDIALTPGVPTSITVANPITNRDSFTISWGDSSGEPNNYRLERQFNDGAWAVIDTLNTPKPANVVNKVTDSGNYRYRISGCRTTGSYTSCSESTSSDVVIKAPLPSFSVLDAVSASEGEGTFVRFAVTKSGPTGEDFTVGYYTDDLLNGGAVKGQDYATTFGTLLFAPSKQDETLYVDVPLINNDAFETQESFKLVLFNASSGASISDDNALGSIIDDDSPPDFWVLVNDSLNVEGTDIEVAIMASNPTEVPMHIAYATSIGATDSASQSDFSATSGSVMFAKGDPAVKFVKVPTIADVVFEGDETFSFNISISDRNSSAIAAMIDIVRPKGTQTIQEDDAPPTFSVVANQSSINEGGTLDFTITQNGLSAYDHVVGFATLNGSAVEGEDFIAKSGSLSFPANTSQSSQAWMVSGETEVGPKNTPLTIPYLLAGSLGFAANTSQYSQTQVVSIDTVDDTIFENNERFSLVLSAPDKGATLSLGQDSADGIILNNDDQPHFSISNVTVKENADSPVAAVFTIKKTGASNVTHTLDYATADGSAREGSDYSKTFGRLTFTPGDNSKTVSVPIIDNGAFELTENFGLMILATDENVILDNTQGIATIEERNLPPVFDVDNVETNEGGVLSFTLTKTGATTLAHTVTYLVTNGTAQGTDYAATNGSQVFSPADTTATIQVQTNDDSFREANETVLFGLVNASNGAVVGNGQGIGTILDNDKDDETMLPDRPSEPVGKPSVPQSADSDRVGALAGTFRVNEGGAATYTVPIFTPKGTAGVTPEISLNYSSQAGYGLLGKGWAISGMSSIGRCRQTLSVDGRAMPITLSQEDRFCLDGQRLLVEPGQIYGAVGASYHTEIDSFARIRSHGGSAGHPDYFTVISKDGSIQYYGNAPDALQRTSDGRFTLSWAQNRTEDSIGNPIVYTYDNDADGLRVRDIQYAFGTNNISNTRVTFTYERREDISSFYVRGYRFASTRRLAKITVTNNGNPVRQYNLRYKALDPLFYEKVSYLESLEECVGFVCRPATEFEWSFNNVGYKHTPVSVTSVPLRSDFKIVGVDFGDINGDGCTDLSIVERDFDDAGVDDDNLHYFRSDCRSLQAATYYNSSEYSVRKVNGGVKIKLADYNADGLADLFVYHNNSWSVQPSVIDRRREYSGQLAFTGLPLPLTDPNTVFGDFNSDGLVDALYPKPQRVGQKFDGNFELRFLEPNSTQLSSSNHYSFSEPVSLFMPEPASERLDTLRVVGDIDGDGILDIATEGRSNCGSRIGCSSPVMLAYYTLDLSHNKINLFLNDGRTPKAEDVEADINNDGFVDFVQDGGVKLNLGGTGVGAFISSGITEKKFSVTDFNGDGYLDFVSYTGKVALWNPGIDRFSEPFGILYPKLADRDSVYYLDVNGDGKTDQVTFTDGNIFKIYPANVDELPSPQIVAIDNGFGNRTDISYGPLLETEEHYEGVQIADNGLPNGDLGEFYRKLNGGWDLPAGSQTLGKIAPVLQLMGPYYVVKRVSGSSPSGDLLRPGAVNPNAQSHIRYQYREAKVQASGRGLLGFAALTTIDEQTGIKTTTTNRQDFPFVGYPQETSVRTAAGHELSRSTNTWQLQNWDTVKARLGNVAKEGTQVLGSLQTVLQKTVANTYDLASGGAQAGSLLSTVTTTNTFDGEGNITLGEVFTEGDGQWFKVVTANQYGTGEVVSLHGNSFSYPEMGRLTRTEVITSRSDDYDATPQSRASAFTYYGSGKFSGMLRSEVIEPGQPDLSLSTEYQYDVFGNKSQVTSVGSEVTPRTASSIYDASGRYVEVTKNGLGQVTSTVLQRNALGQATEMTDINGVFMSMDYGVFGDKVQEYVGTGAWSQTLRHNCNDGSCPAGAQFYVHTRQAGGSESYTYLDSQGRTVRESTLHFDGSLTHVDSEFDNLGRVLRKSEPHGGFAEYWTSMSYDILGRVVRTYMPGRFNPMQMSYEGFRTVTLNTLNQRKIEWANALGELREVTDNIGGIVRYRYDSQGNPRAVHQMGNDNASSSPILTCFDRLGRKVATRDPDKGGHVAGSQVTCPSSANAPVTGWWLYRYNVFGELIEQIDPKGQRSKTDYDVLGRTSRHTDSLASGVLTGDMNWIYNDGLTGVYGLGSIAATYDLVSGYAKVLDYDRFGRIRTTVANLGGDGDDNHYQSVNYDQFGRVFQNFDIAGEGSGDSGTQNRYNDYGYLAEISNANLVNGRRERYQVILDVDRRGNTTRYLNGNGLVTTKYFDAATGRLNDIVTELGVGLNRVQASHYEWDDLDNLKLRRELGAGKNLQETFQYDALNRLERSDVLGGNSQSLRYDSLGNITYKSDVGTYRYGSQCGNGGFGVHAVCETSDGVRFQYDANGNLTGDSATTISRLNNGEVGGRQISYNGADLPEIISKGSKSTRFRYAPDRSRFLRTDTDTSGTTTTRYIGNVEKITYPDGSQEMKRYLPGGALITLKLDSQGKQISKQTQFRYMDHLGSLDVITDSVGSLENSYSFDSWGQRRDPSSWKAFSPTELREYNHKVTTRGFTGHEMLDEMGLIHMNARLYDPRLGRFIQADSLIDGVDYSQGYNRYSYVYNNPLNATDPTGNFGIALFVAIVAASNGVGVTATALLVAAAGFADALTEGASFNQALKAGVFSGISSAAFAGISNVTIPGLSKGASTFVLRGVTGGTLATLQGGKFGHGFVSAALPGSIADSFSAPYQAAARIVASATITKLTGGKFANGAVTAAFGELARYAGAAAAAAGRRAEFDKLAKQVEGERILLASTDVYEDIRPNDDFYLNKLDAYLTSYFGDISDDFANAYASVRAYLYEKLADVLRSGDTFGFVVGASATAGIGGITGDLVAIDRNGITVSTFYGVEMGVALGYSVFAGVLRYPGPRQGLEGFGGEVGLQVVGGVGAKGSFIFSGKTVGGSLGTAGGAKVALSVAVTYTKPTANLNYAFR